MDAALLLPEAEVCEDGEVEVWLPEGDELVEVAESIVRWHLHDAKRALVLGRCSPVWLGFRVTS